MIDFGKLVESSDDVNYNDLNMLFESLDRKTSHTEARPAQKESFDLLTKSREKGDVVLKISTGAGKTAVGLSYLYSYMKEKQEPVVYLCPTNQLVEQVCNEAPKMGIKAVRYPAGQKHPGVDAMQAKAVIVCTYDKLFNAKTTFNRRDVLLTPCAMVLDDAHAGIEIIRKSFTLSLNNEQFRVLTSVLNSRCNEYRSGAWADILNGDPLAIMEIPFWIWQSLEADVRKSLSVYKDESEFRFVWPYLSEILKSCKCIISGTGAEIIPDVIPIGFNRAYSDTAHKLFMTATLADESTLVRELGCSPLSANTPLIPETDRGLGERMVIAPSLVDRSLTREMTMSVCRSISFATLKLTS
ncbi:MAG: DEAD/DEAH box helicase family protein [Deltaproteobacteria bacterium]|nr:DEAD/DEAH box helicase family protein [Deltaproteobacteria bacterium]